MFLNSKGENFSDGKVDGIETLLNLNNSNFMIDHDKSLYSEVSEKVQIKIFASKIHCHDRCPIVTSCVVHGLLPVLLPDCSQLKWWDDEFRRSYLSMRTWLSHRTGQIPSVLPSVSVLCNVTFIFITWLWFDLIIFSSFFKKNSRANSYSTW